VNDEIEQDGMNGGLNEHEILLSMLDAAESGEAADFRDTFDSAMRLKINDLLDQRKQEIAASMAGGALEDSEPESEDVQEEEVELTDEEVDEILESLTEEELEALAEELEEEELAETATKTPIHTQIARLNRKKEKITNKAAGKLAMYKKNKKSKPKNLDASRKHASRTVNGLADKERLKLSRLYYNFYYNKAKNSNQIGESVDKKKITEGSGGLKRQMRVLGATGKYNIAKLAHRIKTSARPQAGTPKSMRLDTDKLERELKARQRTGQPTGGNTPAHQSALKARLREDLTEGSSGRERQKRVGDARIRKAGDIDWGITSPSKDRKGRSEGQYNRTKDLYKRGTGKRRQKRKFELHLGDLKEVKKVSSERLPRGMTVRATPNPSVKDDIRNFRRQSVLVGKGNWYPQNGNDPVGSGRTKSSMATSDSKFRKNKIKLRRRGPSQYNLFDKDINEGSRSPARKIRQQRGIDKANGGDPFAPAPRITAKGKTGSGGIYPYASQSTKVRDSLSRYSARLAKEAYNQKYPGWDRITSTVTPHDEKQAKIDAKNVEAKKASAKKTYSKAVINYMKAQGKNPDGTPIKETSDDTVKNYAAQAKKPTPALLSRDKFLKKTSSLLSRSDIDDVPEEPKASKKIKTRAYGHTVTQRREGEGVTQDMIKAAQARFQARLAAKKK
jgi:hypothetical protein